MNENLKYYGKLSLIGIFSWLKIYALSALSTVFATIISLWYLKDIMLLDAENKSQLAGPHVSGEAGLIQMFIAHPLQIIMFLLIFPCLFLKVGIGSRYVFKKLASKVVHERSEDLIVPAIDGVMNLAKSTIHEPILKLSQATGLKKQLVLTARRQKQNKWVKKAIVYGLKKADLEDVDFGDENVDIYDNLKEKAISKIESIVAPNRTGFWLAVAAQWVCVLVIYLSFLFMQR